MKIKQIGITFPNLTHAYGKQPTNHNKATPKILRLTNKSENTPEPPNPPHELQIWDEETNNDRIPSYNQFSCKGIPQDGIYRQNVRQQQSWCIKR